mmetsp:Transcript_27373/g.26435  ORF Transcript_27373/g.26435 Transcript_27373/m.26435 type:complete len:93 (+) Transcript_27373:248-526(+)
MSVAIDFTGSNGDPKSRNSLHYVGKDGQNQYEDALLKVGAILEPYSFKGNFALMGFGGIPKYLGGSSVSHCFNLSGQYSPEVQGLSEVHRLY